jgi:hypothetical protein
MRWARMSLGPRPMYSSSKRATPSQIADSISPWVFMTVAKISAAASVVNVEPFTGARSPGSVSTQIFNIYGLTPAAAYNGVCGTAG